MKKILSLLLLVVCCSLSAMAQDVLRISKTNGETLTLNVAEIDEMSFATINPNAEPIGLNVTKWCLAVNQQLHLEAKTKPATGMGHVVSASWNSSNPAVASVDNQGVVTGKTDGETVITADYQGATAQMKVKVMSGKQFDISVKDIRPNNCNIEIHPADPNVKYYHNLRVDYMVTNMVEHGSLEENLVWFTWDWCDFVSGLYNISREEYIRDTEFLTKGDTYASGFTYYSTGLENGQPHTLYCMGMDDNGDLTTPVEYVRFETPAVQPVDMTFEVELLGLNSSDCMFRITPSDPDAQYFVNVQSYDKYVSWFEEHNKLPEMIEDITRSFANSTIMPSLHRGVSYVMDGNQARDLRASDFLNTVRSDEMYCIIICGYDGGITTPVTYKRFRTKSGWTEADEPEKVEIITVTPPTGVTTHPADISFVDLTQDDTTLEITYAPYGPFEAFWRFKDGKFYLKNVFDQLADGWVMGEFDATNNTVSFPYPQYIGNFDFSMGDGMSNVYFVGAQWDENWDNGEYCNLIMDYDPVNYTLKSRPYATALVNIKPTMSTPMMTLTDYVIELGAPLK